MQTTPRHERHSRPLRSLLSVAMVAALLGASSADDCNSEHRIQNFKSRHFDVHTDLSQKQLADRMVTMESVLRQSEDYWGRPLTERITCYLVHELENWQPQDFPASGARVVLRQIGGGTFIDRARIKRRIDRSSIIYATTRAGVVEHEVVHAYCYQAFGASGPDWYREGMAELMAQNATQRTAANCRPETLAALRNGTPLSLKKIVSRHSFTDPIGESILRATNEDAVVEFDVTSSWDSDDDRALAKAKIAYAESWALCYLLHHNPNYHKRFRVLGRRIVEGSDIRFEDVFRPMMENVEFELQMLGESIDNGYRADLCRWPWAVAFQPIQVGRSIKVPLKACAGFQATRIRVKSGQEYSLHANGSWSVDVPYRAVGADGNDKGTGCIEAIVQDGYELSDPFPLQADSSFSVRRSGRLFLRCLDDWAQLADNRGAIQVRVKRTK